MRSISRLNYDRWGCNLNGLDLFTGSGIGSLAFKHTIPDYRTVCYVEWEPYCQAQIISRIADGVLDDAPIWDDIRSFDGNQWRGKVDIITGGFPCQPFSVAGKRQGEADERNMWPDTIRVISEVRPRYAKYIKLYGKTSWELDALDPRTLTKLVQQAINKYRDERLWKSACSREEEYKDDLRKFAETWNDKH